MTCVKPFTIPDKWTEKQTPRWDGNDTYDAYNNKGVPLAEPGHLYSGRSIRATPATTGSRISGQKLMIRAGPARTSSQLLLLARDRRHGAPAARSTAGISPTATPRSCTGAIRWSRSRATWSGPTIQGADDLIARIRAPTGTPAANAVKGSPLRRARACSRSRSTTRSYYDSGKRNGRDCGSEVTPTGSASSSRTSRATDSTGGSCRSRDRSTRRGPAPDGAFPKAIRLVK